MHETGLCEAVVEAVVRRAAGQPVAWARVRVGGHAVDPDVVAHGVDLAAAGTVAAGAAVEVVVDPLRARCRSCGAEAPADDGRLLAACAACGGVDVEVVSGSGDAVVEDVRYRTPEREETAWTP